MWKELNRTIKILVASDFLLNYGWGLWGPLFSLYVAQKITGGDITKALEIVGIAVFFYWVPKSLIQLFTGRYLDQTDGEKDDFWAMVGGTFLTALTPFIFLISYLPWHIYIAQLIHGIGMAFAIPSWSAIFTRHIDEGKEASEWGIESASVGIAAGIGGAIGGVLAAIFGFKAVLLFTIFFNLLSASLLFLIKKEMSPRRRRKVQIPISSFKH